MSIESRIRRLVTALSVEGDSPRNVFVARQCKDDPELFEFNGRRMTKAEVRDAVDPRGILIFLVRAEKKPRWRPEQD